MELKELLVGDVIKGFGLGGAVMGGGTHDAPLCNSGVENVSYRVWRRTKAKVWGGLLTVTREEEFDVAFRWLPYAKGRINWGYTEGRDVLSGLYSGCLMARYQDGGAFKVAHIFCDEVVSDDCKAKWAEYAPGYTGVTQFKPSDHRTEGTSGDRIFGLITSTGERWTLWGRPFDERVKNLGKEYWQEYFRRPENRPTGTKALSGKALEDALKPIVEYTASQKTAPFSQLYGISLEICGTKRVTG